MRRLGQTLLAIGALLAIGSAGMHGLVARPVVIGRLPAEVAADTIEGLHAAWTLGTLAIAAFGALVLLGIPSLGRDRGAWRAPLIAGLFFLGYGGWAWVYRHFHSHFFGFIAIGALLVAGALLGSRGRSSSR